jgi:hypothetical protein
MWANTSYGRSGVTAFEKTSKMIGLLRSVRLGTERLIVLLVELGWRVFHRFNRSLYSEALRIREVTEGTLAKPSQKFFILVLYCNGDIPGFSRTLIDAIGRSQFNLVAVSNGTMKPEARAELLGKSCLFIQRNNVGRDFGGYKDGINIVLRRFAEIERLIIANDSVFYLPTGLDQLITSLDADDDFVGVSETFKGFYHVASFMLSFGKKVISSDAFVQFWRDYRPLGSRQWAIFEGEGKLVRRLMRAGFKPRALYRVEDLTRELNTAEGFKLLPTDIRARLSDPPGHSRESVGGRAASEIMKHNQMHAAGLLFYKFRNLPLVKRDIVFREIYPLAEVATLLDDLEDPLRDEIIADLRRRGGPEHFGYFRRLMHRHG